MKVVKVLVFNEGALDSLGKFFKIGTGHAAIQIGDQIYSSEGGRGFTQYAFDDYANKNQNRPGDVFILILKQKDDGTLEKSVSETKEFWTPFRNCSYHVARVLDDSWTQVEGINDPQKLIDFLIGQDVVENGGIKPNRFLPSLKNYGEG
ncbi:MAG: hypothetical protein KGI33_07375 [Thaumarchaeota archaeon]|nr:hypothetical protein [Nitrososphaerota archaeon]